MKSSPSIHALRSPWSASEVAVARATIGSAVIPSSRRRASTAPKSTSIHDVTVAAVESERYMCSPISRRMRERSVGGGGA
jgi:hypothetical protein